MDNNYQEIIKLYQITLNKIDNILAEKIQEYAKKIQTEQNTVQMIELLAKDIAFLSGCRDKIHKINNENENFTENKKNSIGEKYTLKYNSVVIAENISQRKIAYYIYKHLIENKILSQNDYQQYLGIGKDKNKFGRKFESKIGDILTKEQRQELIDNKNNAKRIDITDYNAEEDYYNQRYEYDASTDLYYSKEWDKESISRFINFMEKNYNIQIQSNNKIDNNYNNERQNMPYERPKTLHEAMKIVLEEQKDKKMSVKELAEELNARQLYTKRDKSRISYHQLYARANHHRELFDEIKNGIISLR